MTKKLKLCTLSVLTALLIIALAFIGLFALAPKSASAATLSDDGTTVTFDTIDDFVTNSKKTRIDDLSENAWKTINDNIDSLTSIVIDIPDTITIGLGAPFYTAYSQKIAKPIPITLYINAYAYLFTNNFPTINVVKAYVDEGNEDFLGSADGNYLIDKMGNTVAWSNGVLPEDAEITGISNNGALCGENIHIPANITTIPQRTLYTDNTKTITVAADNPAYSDGGGNNCLVDKENKILMTSPSGYIPSDGTVTSIANGALRNASEVTIPATVETFTNQIFGDALTKLTIAPDHPTYIDGGNNCVITKADKKLVLATKATNMATVFDGVEIVGSNAFNGLDITELTVPDTVKQMEGGALGGLAKLETLSLPFVGREKTIAGGTAGVETRFGYVFPSGSADSNYFSIYQKTSESSTAYSLIPKTLKTVSITGSGITLLDWSLMYLEETNINNIYLPDDISFQSVCVIEGFARDNTAVTSPLNKYSTANKDDGNYYLYSATDHTKPVVLLSGNKDATLVEIPEGVRIICQLAFQSAKAVEVVLPSTLKDVQTMAFRWCRDLAVVYNLSELDIQRGSEDYGGVAYYAATVSDEYNGSMIKEEGDYTFVATEQPALYRYNGTEESLTLPADYNGKRYTIADGAFRDNTSVVDVVIPANSAVSIGNSAFENCTSLKSIVINDLENSIGTAAFKGCTSLTSITFYNCHITEIADEAFSGCSSLLSVAVPNTVIRIGKQAFDGCTSAVEISLGNNVEYIGGSAFRNTTSLKTASIPDSVKRLGNDSYSTESPDGWNWDYLFRDSGIESVYIGSGVKYLGATFTDCKNLREVTFADNNGLLNISYAFQGCSALTTLAIPETVTKATQAFSGCVSLTSLYVPYGFIEAYDGREDLFDSSFVYNEYSHLTMYLPEVQGATDEEKAESAKKILAFALYFDRGNMWAHYMNTLVSYTSTTWGGPEEKTEENYAQWLSNATNAYHKYSVCANVKFIMPSKASYDSVYAILSDADYYKSLGESGRNFNMTVTVKKTEGTGNVTLPLFPELSQDSLLAKFFYVVDVNYELYKQMSGGNTVLVDKQTVQKLANNAGADIRLVLKTDKYGSKYYVIDENYAMPSMIGATNATGAWKVGSVSGDAFTLDGAKISGATTLVNLLGADAKLVVNVDEQYEDVYDGDEWTLPASLADKASITSVNGVAGGKIVNAGTYTVVITAGDDYEFAGGAGTKEITVVITKAQAELVWTYDGVKLTEGETRVKTFDGKTIASKLVITYVDAKGATQTINLDHLSRTLNGEATIGAAMGAGDWVLYISDLIRDTQYPNYVFTHASQSFRIDNAVLSKSDVLTGTEIDLAGTATLNSGMLYIYEDTNHNIIPSRTPLSGYTLVEVINVERSIVRYTNREWTLDASVNNAYADKLALNADRTEHATQTAIGRQTTTFVFNAKDNYVFDLAINGGIAERGLTFTVSQDGKTLTVTKTWYVVQLANELVNATYTGTNEPTDADLYTVANWTYGDNVTFTLPRLWHGDESANWQTDNSHVKFTLTMQGVADPIVSNANRSVLLNYLNKYMPAGNYTLTVTVSAFDTDDASYPTFSRIYDFTVAKAAITIDESKLPKNDNTGYADYAWELTGNANKQLFFKDFADKITANGVLNTVVMKDTVNNANYWMNEGKTYFGDYEVKYNFARRNNEVYVLSNNNDILTLIDGGAKGTYTVYFQVEMKNHENLTNVGTDGRYAYFFTVTVWEKVATPVVSSDGLVYTGNKVQPVIAESLLYETVWSDVDTYVAGGTHSVSFKLYDKVHYRWADSQTDTVSVNFTIAKADNVFTVALNMLGWNYETFDAAVNNVRATARYLDDGQSIHFRVVKKGETAAISGLTDFTIDANGKVNETVAAALNALKVGEYVLYAKVNETGNYKELERNVSFAVAKSINTWADGEDDLVLPSWIVGTFNLEENPIVVKAAHGEAIIEIRDMDGNVYYNSLKPEENTLNTLDVGKYLLVAWVDESEDYAALAERSFTIEVLEKIGLPWWGTTLIAVGSLAVAAAIILILWKLKVFEILTDKISLAITTRATVDATIAAVRATKKAEEADAHKRKVEARERLEAAREANRNKTPEQRAEELAAKAEVTATRADKLHARASKMREKADKLAGKTEQNSDVTDEVTENPDDTSTEE